MTHRPALEDTDMAALGRAIQSHKHVLQGAADLKLSRDIIQGEANALAHAWSKLMLCRNGRCNCSTSTPGGTKS